MKRNWYALVLLVMLALLMGCGTLYVHATASTLRRDVSTAYACTLTRDYPNARQAYQATAAFAEARGAGLRLFVRRALVDKMEETLATLSHYANADNQADLAVESARALAQIEEMETSFWGGI